MAVLIGKMAIVTGAVSGVSKEIALRAAHESISVIATDLGGDGQVILSERGSSLAD